MESSNNQKYYLHYNGEKQGPFSLKEIDEKEIEIHSDTLVWTKGMKAWEKAEKIEDFDQLVNRHLPPDLPNENHNSDSDEIPPIPTENTNKHSTQNTIENDKLNSNTSSQKSDHNSDIPKSSEQKKSEQINKQILKNNYNNKRKAIVIVSVIVVILTLVIFFVDANSKNKRNEALLQLQQQTIEEHQKKIQAQQAAERNNKIKQLNEILATLKIERDEALVYLRSSEIQLNDLQQFKFLRTASEKNQQIRNQLSLIQGWEDEVNRLNNEIQKIQREIERLKY